MPNGKVNIDTDIGLAMTGAMRKQMHQMPGEFDPRAFFKAAVAAAQALVQDRYQAFGCTGQASRLAARGTPPVAARA